MLKKTLKDISSHSFLYSIIWITGSATSIVLLPIYTKYLSRSDYGILEILDYTNVFLYIIIGAGLNVAIPKIFNDATEIEKKEKVIDIYGFHPNCRGGNLPDRRIWKRGLAEIILGDEKYKSFVNLNIILLFSQLVIFISGMNFIVRKESKKYLVLMLM